MSSCTDLSDMLMTSLWGVLDLLVHFHQWESLAFDDVLLAENVDEYVRNRPFFELRSRDTEIVLSSRIELEVEIDIMLFCHVSAQA